MTDTDGDGLTDGQEVLPQLSNPLLPDTDGDTMGDGVEVFGWGAWDVRLFSGCTWVDPGSNAIWVTDWQPEQVSEGYVDSGYSAPIAAPLILGAYTGTTFQVSVDGFLLIDSAKVAGELSPGLNKPLPCPEMDRAIAPFWDDLRVSAFDGVWVEVFGTGLAMRVVATWEDAEVESAAGLNEALDVQCEYAAATRSYTFRYRPAQGRLFPSASTCTIGIQGGLPGSLACVAFNDSRWPQTNVTVQLSPALTQPKRTDTDNDGWTDDVEALLGMNPVVAEDPQGDSDGDGVLNGLEAEQGTDPTTDDSDGDGFSDGEESFWGMDPLTPCDPDGDEDGDGLANWDEWVFRCNPLQADTDGDGASDWLEVEQGSDPADFSDYGMAPAETMEVVVQLQGGALPLSVPVSRGMDASSLSIEQPAEPHGTILKIGNIRFRCRPGSAGGSIGRFRLAKGRTYDLVIYSQDGQVQEVPVWSTIEIDGLPPVPVPGQPRWICGSAVIDNPAATLGERPVMLSESKAAHSTLRGYTLALEGPSGERPPQAEWPLDAAVGLTAVLSPGLEGQYAWTTDVESIQMEADGSNAVIHVGAVMNVQVSFTPDGAAEPMLTCSAPLRPAGHACTWGNLVMDLPLHVRYNDNDSDLNSMPDLQQDPPPAADPDLRLVTFLYDDAGVLPCCRKVFAGAKVTLTRLLGGTRIRMWNEDVTAPFPMPFEASFGASPWIFQLEGVESSYEPLDVAFQADVTFDSAPSLFRIYRTTVLRVSVVNPVGSADGHPDSRSRFVMDAGAPYRYDWQAVSDSLAGNGSLCRPDGVINCPATYDYAWSITPSCGTLELTGSSRPIHFPPPGVSGTHQDGDLKLEVALNGQPTGIFDTKKVRVYDDHLRRDMENFTPENLVPFHSVQGTMVGAPRSLGFICHNSTSHALSGNVADASWLMWNCSTSYTFYASGYQTPPFEGLERGDIVAYFKEDYDLFHSQTCTGNGSETWGANNEPLQWDPNTHSFTNRAWFFTTAPAGVHYQNADPNSFPMTIKVYKKPGS